MRPCIVEIIPASRADVAAVTALLSARLSGEPVVSPESGRVTAQVDDGRHARQVLHQPGTAQLSHSW